MPRKRTLREIALALVLCLVGTLTIGLDFASKPLQASATEPTSGSEGSEFFFVVHSAGDLAELRQAHIVVAGSSAGEVSLTINSTSVTRSFSANSPLEISLSSIVTAYAFDAVVLARQNTPDATRVFRLTSSAEISLHLFVGGTSNSDGTLVLPSTALGTQYQLFPFNAGFQANYRLKTIIATSDNTRVTVSNFVGLGGFTNGATASFTLQAGQRITLEQDSSTFRGRVAADKPIAIFESLRNATSAFSVAGINFSMNANDFMMHQSLPLSSIGREYVFVSSPNSTISDTIAILATEDQTIVDVGGLRTFALSASQLVTLSFSPTVSAIALISSSKPVIVAQQVNADTFNLLRVGSSSATGDVGFAFLVPTRLFARSYLVTAPKESASPNFFLGYKLGFALISLPKVDKAKLRLNGNFLDPSLFIDIPGSDWAYTRHGFTSSQVLKFESTNPFGLTVMGADHSKGGYIYSAGISGPGPQASFGLPTTTPSSTQVPLQCSASCGDGNNFTYSARLLALNEPAKSIDGTAPGNLASLNFTSLSAGVIYTLEVRVTKDGAESALSTLEISTPRPIATISALAIADTSATLTVGCSNCGAAPSSFTVSATPVLGGGAAITSNTSVITGLTSETTYSFSVVVAFAGTTSNSLLWQGNPVRTLPFVPVISNVSPSFLPLGGGQVTVTGANFSTSNQLSLRGVTLSFTIVNGTTITFTAPSDGAGSFDLAIRNPAGTYTLSSAITYVLAPTLSTNSPILGTTNGGTIVTLTGANLLGTSRVNLGTTTVSFTVISDSKIRFTTPATAAAVVDIGVVTAGGSATLSNGIEFTSSALIPVITSITPATGPIAGGTTVTVIGQFFSGSYSDAISAAINGVSGSAIVLIDDSTFTFVTPAHPAGVGLDLGVFTGGGLGILMGAFTYTAPPVQAPPTPVAGGSGGSSFTAPEISSFSSRVLLTSGGTITLTGKNLEFVSSLMLGGILVTVVGNSATSLTFAAGTLPVGTWYLELINIYGKLTYLNAIEVKAPEVIVEVMPEAPIKGTLIGSRWSTVFLGNSRALNPSQVFKIGVAQQRFAAAKTVVCYGYTTNRIPNSWATNHALSRATAVCEGIKKSNPGLRTQVRLRFGESKSFAMRSSMQFWK